MADDLKQKLVAGMTSCPKYIPTWYNYDDVGSRLQRDSCETNRDYYFTKSQISFLKQNAKDIIPEVSGDLTLVDLGSGDCSKTRFVIDELLKRQKTLTFYPVDISGEFLLKSTKELSEEYDDSLVVRPLAADYAQGIDQLRQISGAKMILWIGSMISLPYDDQINTLRMISTMMTDKCRLVFVVDITQDSESIIKAYNDDAGLKRRFYQYAITRMNKEEGSKIDLDKFMYKLDFVRNTSPEYMSYVRSYMEAREDIRYTIPGLGTDLVMEKGEQLYFHEGAGLSCKYTLGQLQTIVQKAGLRLVDTRVDERKHAAFCQCVTT
ncbi:histidine N-alpha-methyltransferase-like [Pecten maximus]|uniref:histidine N-alpha-methyltransferase-like n=1 Tax=Pecten maximus TaxID=6579 RepID=UPI0014582944|nr:histidine N-alpha-methyltransferase-like [Pecten maximus]